MSEATPTRLRADRVTLGYGDAPGVLDLSVDLPDGAVTTIIGPNGCGKSTLLRALGRLLRPSGGAVVLDGQAIHRLPTKEVARRLGLLAQQPVPPDGVTVQGLAQRGRFPHQSFLQGPSATDAAAVDRALELAGMADLRSRPVDELSGGQRQRAWIAMVLAQETPLLLLDEPTTYLDLAHQLDVLELVQRLNVEEGRTVAMVLHDISQAARVSHRLVAMRAGRIVRQGPPGEVVEPVLLGELFGAPCDVYPHPVHAHPVYVPRGQPDAGPSLPPRPPSPGPAVAVDGVRVGYRDRAVLRDLSLAFPGGRVTAIVGPNACGKSTLLRTVARLLRPSAGTATIAGQDVRAAGRGLAKTVALLAQGATPPAGTIVEDLVAFGRVPHQGVLRQWSVADERAVEAALHRCGVADLRLREVDGLSGGQRQRVWFAMALAQETSILLLDEPTTFLDPGAQVELLELAASLGRTDGRTVVMVLHDLSLAARYADHVVAMADGRVVATGPPAEVLTVALLRDVFRVEATVVPDPATGAPLVLPGRTTRPAAADHRSEGRAPPLPAPRGVRAHATATVR